MEKLFVQKFSLKEKPRREERSAPVELLEGSPPEDLFSRLYFFVRLLQEEIVPYLPRAPHLAPILAQVETSLREYQHIKVLLLLDQLEKFLDIALLQEGSLSRIPRK